MGPLILSSYWIVFRVSPRMRLILCYCQISIFRFNGTLHLIYIQYIWYLFLSPGVYFTSHSAPFFLVSGNPNISSSFGAYFIVHMSRSPSCWIQLLMTFCFTELPHPVKCGVVRRRRLFWNSAFRVLAYAFCLPNGLSIRYVQLSD